MNTKTNENYLTKREAEVAAYLIHGFSNREICDRLFVCEKTIKFHATHIYKKLKVSSKSKLSSAYHRGLLDENMAAPIKPLILKIFGEPSVTYEKNFLPYGVR